MRKSKPVSEYMRMLAYTDDESSRYSGQLFANEKHHGLIATDGRRMLCDRSPEAFASAMRLSGSDRLEMNFYRADRLVYSIELPRKSNQIDRKSTRLNSSHSQISY